MSFQVGSFSTKTCGHFGSILGGSSQDLFQCFVTNPHLQAIKKANLERKISPILRGTTTITMELLNHWTKFWGPILQIQGRIPQIQGHLSLAPSLPRSPRSSSGTYPSQPSFQAAGRICGTLAVKDGASNMEVAELAAEAATKAVFGTESRDRKLRDFTTLSKKVFAFDDDDDDDDRVRSDVIVATCLYLIHAGAVLLMT